MTECERLIQSGFITNRFLEEETICGFRVDSSRKKDWAICMDLLSVFERICIKHNLTYFLTFGSLLGAIRHNGFVPWDDDIDLFMLREDFDKLYGLCSEFKPPYFLQTPYSDPDFFITTIRLRNTNTTYIAGPFKYQNFNHGISISVAPLDYLPENYTEIFPYVHKLIMDNGTYMRRTNPNLDERDQLRVKEYSGSDPLKTYERIHEIARGAKHSNKLWSLVSQPYKMEHLIFDELDYQKAIYHTFESKKYSIPIGYEKILSNIYGDWRKFPEMADRGKRHNKDYYNADIPYKEYLRRNN